jgi:hypothetical protein
MPTVTFYNCNDKEIGGEITVILFDAQRPLTKDQLSNLAQRLTEGMCFGVYDGIHDPPEYFATGLLFKNIDPDLERDYLPGLRTLFARTLAAL